MELIKKTYLDQLVDEYRELHPDLVATEEKYGRPFADCLRDGAHTMLRRINEWEHYEYLEFCTFARAFDLEPERLAWELEEEGELEGVCHGE
jgi:hypothetical protein